MERYLEQLLADIDQATGNPSFPFVETEVGIMDWISNEEEDKTAPIRQLEEWTGIKKEQLPPQQMLTDDQLSRLLVALGKMLDAYNCSFVLQIKVPNRIQYSALREYFDQEVRVKRWNMGFFEMCRPGTEHGKCALGEYCQCAFYAELFSGFVDEERSPEEDRAASLRIEVEHLKRKYGDEWMKYYPYHLDPEYDDEDGNPYNYGFEGDDD